MAFGAALLLCSCADDSAPADEGNSTEGSEAPATSSGGEPATGEGDASTGDGTGTDSSTDGGSDSTDGEATGDDTTGDDTTGDDTTGDDTTGGSSSGDDTTGDPAVCGDAEITLGREDCEPGFGLLDSCESLGFDDGELSCTNRCTYDTSACFTCGDGVLAAAELCEPGLPLTQDCTDVGFDGGTLACTDGCMLDTSGCFECGDGALNPGEACDGDAYPDGFLQDNCAGYGHTGGILACTNECTIDDSACTDFAVPVEGEVIVTEIRKPPEAVGNAWFELHNLADEPRQLNACVLSFAGAGLSFLDEFLIPGGGYAVVGTTDPVAGIVPTYEFAVPLLGPFTQNIVLSCGGSAIDAVAMDGFDFLDFYELIDGMQVEISPNASMQLDPDFFDAVSNGLAENWCTSTSPIPGGTDLGTPGAPNDECPP